MPIKESFYSSKEGVRPKPIIKEIFDGSTFLVATPWGPRDQAEQEVANAVRDLESLFGQGGTVSGAEPAPQLTDELAKISWVLQKTNNELVEKVNAVQAELFMECLIVSAKAPMLSWIGVGQPHLFINRGQGWNVLRATPDWVSASPKNAPLVSQALGKSKTIYPSGGQIMFNPGDSLLLLSRSEIPKSIWHLNQINHDSIHKEVASDSTDMPFWLGTLI